MEVRPNGVFITLKEYLTSNNKYEQMLAEAGYYHMAIQPHRDKDGNYIGFVPDTIKAFTDAGMHYYNEAILLNAVGTAAIRARGCMKNQKLVKLHQNILVFKK